jgi:predicted enzyme related to lactoylglutathione lyase
MLFSPGVPEHGRDRIPQGGAVPQLDAITIPVEDMDRTLEFYRLLGLSTPVRTDCGYASADQPRTVRIEWTTGMADGRGGSDTRRRPDTIGIGIAVRCSDPAEVDATYRAVVAAGHTGLTEPFDAPWGSRHSQLLDPHGNVIDLFAPLP